jgi:hypothetical protein
MIMSKRITPFDEIPFTSSRGDTFNPGDSMIALTRSTGQPGLNVGKYLGVRKTSRWGRDHVNVVMEVQRDNIKFVDENDVEYDYNAEWKELPHPHGVRYGTHEYATAAKQREEAVAKRREGFKHKNFPYLGYSTLQNNNVYPGDVAMKDIKL